MITSDDIYDVATKAAGPAGELPLIKDHQAIAECLNAIPPPDFICELTLHLNRAFGEPEAWISLCVTDAVKRDKQLRATLFKYELKLKRSVRESELGYWPIVSTFTESEKRSSRIRVRDRSADRMRGEEI